MSLILNLATASRRPRIAVLRALQLGDLLCFVPAARALRRTLPPAHITLIGLPWARDFVARFAQYFDDFLEFPGWPGLPERETDVPGIAPFFQAAQAARFDLAIQAHGSGTVVNEIVSLLGAARVAGFCTPTSYCPDAATFLNYPDRLPEIERHLALLHHLGASSDDPALEFPLRPADLAEAAVLLPEPGRRGPRPDYVCLHPGARWPSRRWPAERFAAVGDELARRGLRILVTGSKSELTLARRVADAMREPAVCLAGATSLGALAAIVAGARLVVTNDTGMSHVACAVRTPSVVVVLGSDPARWAPLDSARHRTVVAPLECRPCERRICPALANCAEGISSEQVLAEADWLLAQQRPEQSALPARASAGS